MRRCVLLLTALACLAACGGESATAPSDATPARTPSATTPAAAPSATTPQPADAWTGTLNYTFGGTSYFHSVTGTVTQDGSSVKATLTLSNDWNATLDGTLSDQGVNARLNARITFDTPSDHPPMRCAASFNGTSSFPNMVFQTSTVTFGNCDSTISSVGLTLRR